MKTSLSQWLGQHASRLATEPPRRHAVLIAVSVTENTRLTPQQHERPVLAQYVQGELDLPQTVARLST